MIPIRSHSIYDHMNSLLNKFVQGKECWYTSVNASTGSILNLCLGGKVPSKKPAQNPNKSEDFCSFDPEISVMVYCAWRIETKDHVLGGWLDPNHPGGAMEKSLSNIHGKTVTEFHLDFPSFDLTLTLSNMFSIKIFCDQIYVDSMKSNWYIVTNIVNFGVEQGCSPIIKHIK